MKTKGKIKICNLFLKGIIFFSRQSLYTETSTVIISIFVLRPRDPKRRKTNVNQGDAEDVDGDVAEVQDNPGENISM